MYKIYTTKPCWVHRHVPKILLIMKLITVLLIATMMQVSAASFAQKLTLKKDNISLEQLFKEIRKQTGYAVIYTAATIKDSKAINADFQNTPIEEVLTTSLKDQSLKFEIDTKNIIITKAPPTFLDRLAERWADRDIRGRVVDEKGNPLPNASIRVKGKVVKTNEKGEFVIKGVAKDAVLVISYLGYKHLELPLIDAVMPLQIRLNQLTRELEEVNVNYSTGYQNIPKERATGSFVQIDNELFNRKVGSTVLDRILEVTSGLLAGSVATTSGKGEGIQIRGNSTINSSKIPLIVVDNFIYEGDLNNLNPNDVDNITVLKDAAAASIWGVRAGNGVIVITTKKGKYNQDNKIAFNSNVTIGAKPDLDYVKTMSSKDWLEFEKKQYADSVYNIFDDDYPSTNYFPAITKGVEILLAARKKNSGIAGYNALADPLVKQQLDMLAMYDVKDDIKRYLLQNSISQQYTLNASGGSSKSFYYTSVGFDKNRSNSIRNESNRLNLNFSHNYKIFNNLELNSFINYAQTKSNNNTLPFYQFLPTAINSVAPYTKLADINGSALAIPYGIRMAYVDTAAYPALLDWHYQPLEELKTNNNESRQYDTRVGAVIKYTIIPGLNSNLKYQYQRAVNNAKNYFSQETFSQRNLINTYLAVDPVSKTIYMPYPKGDWINNSYVELSNWNFRAELDFNRTFGNHSISAIAGIEYRETKIDQETNNIYGFDPNTSVSIAVNPTVLYPTRFGWEASIGGTPSIDGSINRFGSYFTNAGYTFSQRYIFSVSARVDQSNFFGLKANQRITPLWSAGLGWNISSESFYHAEFLPVLKLRITYGFSGNTNGGSAYATANYVAQNSPYPNQYAGILTPDNPQLRWERVKQINYAIDFSTENNRISGSVEYYTKKGLDLIGPILTDPTVGWNSFVGNKASIKSKGLDLNLNIKNFRGAFNWQTNFLLSYNKDRVTSYERKLPIAAEYLTTNPIVGKPMSHIHSYEWAGLDPTNGTARLYLGDTISNNVNYTKANLSDLIYHGTTTPNIFGSIRNTLSWKQLSFSFNITYRFNYYFRRPSINFNSMFSMTSGWGGHSDYALRWLKPGDESITDVPSLPPSAFFDQRDHVYSYSNLLVERADHIRLQDIRLNYNLSRQRIQKLPFQNVQFYIYVNNLGLLWARNKHGIDPDYISNGTLPATKTFSAGVNITF
jgi:TonB-linked SusC/RagA family outer membrane protein